MYIAKKAKDWNPNKNGQAKLFFFYSKDGRPSAQIDAAHPITGQFTPFFHQTTDKWVFYPLIVVLLLLLLFVCVFLNLLEKELKKIEYFWIKLNSGSQLSTGCLCSRNFRRSIGLLNNYVRDIKEMINCYSVYEFFNHEKAHEQISSPYRTQSSHRQTCSLHSIFHRDTKNNASF